MMMAIDSSIIRVANLSTLPKYFRWEFIEGSNFNFESWVKEREYIWDADNCGDYITFWIVMDNEPKFYKVIHSWYWDWRETSEGEERSLINEFEIIEVQREELDKYAKENLKFVV